jgi:hypothetical protein
MWFGKSRLQIHILCLDHAKYGHCIPRAWKGSGHSGVVSLLCPQGFSLSFLFYCLQDTTIIASTVATSGNYLYQVEFLRCLGNEFYSIQLLHSSGSSIPANLQRLLWHSLDAPLVRTSQSISILPLSGFAEEDAGMNFYLLPLSEYKWVWGFTHYGISGEVRLWIHYLHIDCIIA